MQLKKFTSNLQFLQGASRNFSPMMGLILLVLLTANFLFAAELNITQERGGKISRYSVGDETRLDGRFEGMTAVTVNEVLSGDFQAEIVIDEPVAGRSGFSVRLVPEASDESADGVMAFFVRDQYGNGCLYLAATNRDGQKNYYNLQEEWGPKWGRTGLFWNQGETQKLLFSRKDGMLTIVVQSGKYAIATKELPVSADRTYQLVIGGGNEKNGGEGLFTISSISLNQRKINLNDTSVELPEAKKYNNLPYAGHFAFPGGDGFLQLPENFDANNRYPLILFFHGRGGSACFGNFNTQEFSTFAKLCSERGFIVAAPAYGSDSWLNDAAEKITLDMVGFLQKELPIDPEQIFAMGCSMGGASALMFTARHPDLIQAVCDIFGITDYTLFYEEGKGFRTSLAGAYGGTPQEKPEYYAEHSAINWIDVLKNKPILIIHGTNDGVVPKKHSDNLVKLLKDAGGNVDYRIIPGVGHDNVIIQGQESLVLDFFQKKSKSPQQAQEQMNGPACFQVMKANPRLENPLFIPVKDGGFFRYFANAPEVPWVVSAYDTNIELNANAIYTSPLPFLALNSYATQGEYTFVTFALQTRKEVKDFRFELSDLVGDDGSKLPAEQARLFLVDSKEFLVTPEPGVVPADNFFAMALFLATTEQSPATVYRGKLRIAGGEHEVTMPVNFAVLPVVLPDADFAFGVDLPGHPYDVGDEWGRSWVSKDFLSYRMPMYFRFWKTRCLNSPAFFHFSPTVIGSGRDFKQDFSAIDVMADAIKQNGLRGPFIIDTRFYARWADGAAPRPEYEGISDIELYRLSMEQMLAHSEEKQWPDWLCFPEEEIGNGGDKIVFYEKYWKTLREVVGREREIMVDNDIGQGRKNAIDRGERDKFMRRMYNSWTEEALAAAKRDGAEVWSDNYGWKRFAYGLMQLRLGSRGYYQWADQWVLGGEWYVTVLFDDGIVSSLPMERAHEGINDYRTAQWLRDIDPAKGNDLISQLVAPIPIQRSAAYHYGTSTPDREFMIARWRMLQAGKQDLVGEGTAPGKPQFALCTVAVPRVSEKASDMSLTATFQASTPVIDGMDDNEWKNLKMSSYFRRSKGFEANARAVASSDAEFQRMINISYTAFGPAYSRDGLLLRVYANDSKPQDIDDYGNDDGALWQRDCIEFFFDIPGNATYHLITNARGNRTLMKDGRVVSSEGIEIGTVSPVNVTGGYAQEILIPWSLFGLQRMPGPGTVWGINAGREYHTGKAECTWSQVEHEFGDKKYFGTLRFAADTESIMQFTTRPEILCGKNHLSGKINITKVGNYRNLQLIGSDGQVCATTKVGRDGTFSMDFSVAPSEEAKVYQLTLKGMPDVQEKFIIQGASLPVQVQGNEFFALTGGELIIPVSFLVSERSRLGNSISAVFSRDGKEILRLETPAVSGDRGIASFLLDGVAPGRYELTFALADDTAAWPEQVPVIVNVLRSPYVSSNN